MATFGGKSDGVTEQLVGQCKTILRRFEKEFDNSRDYLEGNEIVFRYLIARSGVLCAGAYENMK